MELETRLSCGPRDKARAHVDGSHMDLETRLSCGPRDEALMWT